jgi:HTH-type transcriptional regulator, competence development regulator
MRQNARPVRVKHAKTTTPRRSPPGRTRTRSALGSLLADLRVAKGFSLRQVEQATDREVSNAYLSQLEQGKIQQPSPSILHRLAAVYAIPYEALMEKAGYLLPATEGAARGRRQRLAAFAIDDLTAEEEEELLKYLAFIRSRKR